MNSIKTLKLEIWGREFNLPVEYEYFSKEYETEDQIKAISLFSKHIEWINNSKGQVEAFCKEEVDRDDDNQKKDNIFSYIKPDHLFVERKESNPRVAIMCKYRYDMEHGLAIVFSNEGEITVGLQDIIL